MNDKLKKLRNKIIFQILFIFLLTVIMGSIYNSLSENGLPLLEKFNINNVKRTLFLKNESYNSIKNIDIDTFRNLIDNDLAVVIDSRNHENYLESYIPGAINIEESNFEVNFKKESKFIHTGKIIVIYGKNDKSKSPLEIAEKLSNRNVSYIYIYKNGIEEWLKKGNNIEYTLTDEKNGSNRIEN